MIESMLTTVDNPFNPFENFMEWFDYDTRLGYHTASFLSRIAIISDTLSEADVNFELEKAVDEIIKENVSGNYKKVTRVIPDI